MSSKDILKQNFDEDTGQSFQVYNEIFDEEGDIYLELEGFQFEAFTSVSFTGNGGNGVPRLTVKLPREWAQKLGLLERLQENLQEEERDYMISRGNVFADLGLPNPEMYLAAARKAHSKAEFIRLCEEIPDTPMAKSGSEHENNAEAVVVLDDELLRKAQELTGMTERTALLRQALKTLIHVEAGRRLAALGGTEPDLEDIRRRRADEGGE